MAGIAKRWHIAIALLLLLLMLGGGRGQAGSNEMAETADFSRYFGGIRGTAVFFQPERNTYIIYQKELSEKRSSPCSTFKIFSTYVGLDTGCVDPIHSIRRWNGTSYWYEPWNRDMVLSDAFSQSCVWYYRQLIDDIGQTVMQAYIDSFQYGNRDITDWTGRRNTNEPLAELKGFWLESSLKISPKEQVQVLYRIMTRNSEEKKDVIAVLKQLMTVYVDAHSGLRIYGKTGYGVIDGKPADAWFIGMYEWNGQTTYFAIRLDDPDNHKVSSKAAKDIALRLIRDKAAAMAEMTPNETAAYKHIKDNR